MRHHAFPDGVTRDALIDWYRAGRARTKALFDLITPEGYYARPIDLRNPIVFYEGHLPAFCVNTLVKLALKRDGVDENLETLFARGIDPESADAVSDPVDVWPSRARVQEYADAADALVVQTLAEAPLEDDAVPELRGGEAVFTILEHELMHQETLLYLFHNLPYEMKRLPGYPVAGMPRNDLPFITTGQPGNRATLQPVMRQPVVRQLVKVARGLATLGACRDAGFGWDNEFPSHTVAVDAFEIERFNVTNADWREFMDATGAAAPHFWTADGKWRGMFADEPLLPDAPVYVTHEQATAYAKWRGMRLPTEAEFHRAAYGSPNGVERPQPWGDAPADATRGHFDFASFSPIAAGSHPDGASAWGVEDLVGNGWEWTATVFDGFRGFEPMPSYLPYSSDFFDGAHYVMKGASPVTARELVRRSFRNWFRPNYPYVYATFRCVR